MKFQDYLADTLQDCVSDRLRNNRDRTALDNFELLLMQQIADNRYNNDSFWKIVDAIDERVEVWEDEILRGEFERDGHRNVDSFIDCLMANTLVKDRMLNDLNDDDYHFIEDVVNSPLYQLLFDNRTRRSRDSGRGRGGGGYQDDRRTSSRDRDYGDTRFTGRDRGREGLRSGVGLRERSPTRDNSHETKRSTSKNNAFLTAARMRESQVQDDPQDRTDSPRRDLDRESRVVREDRPERNMGRSSDDREVTNVEHRDLPVRTGNINQVLNPPPSSKQGYDHTTENPYEEFWEDDCLWQTSVKSEWKLTGTGEDGYMQLYNIYKHVSYMVMDKFGNVTQRFKAVNEGNRYINQTLLKDPDSFKSNFGRKPPKISDIMRGSDTVEVSKGPDIIEEQGGYELEDMIDLSHEEMDEITSMVPSDNLSTSAIEARTRLSESGKDSSLTVFMLMDPIEAVTQQEASLIKDLYSTNTLMALSKNLAALHGKISNASYNRINQKISSYMVDVLKNTFGVPIKQMDFAKDWETVIRGLIKRYGQEWVDNFARRSNALITTILSYVDVTDSSGSISPVFENIVTPQNKDRIVPYVDFYALLSINCTLDQLSIGRQIELESPLILRAVDDIYSSTALNTVLAGISDLKSTVNIGRLLISTTCGALVEVTNHELGTTNIVLSLFSPSK